MIIAKIINQEIEAIPEGKPFSSTQFLTLGSRSSVDQSLSRLVKRGVLSRVTRGVYVRPKYNRFVGNVMPEPLEIAKALAETTGSLVQVHGAEAARQLGLSTQMPTKPFFITNGPNHRFYINNTEIIIKHVTPRKLVCAGTRAGLAITALWYLGKKQVSSETIAHIRKQLSGSEYNMLKSAVVSLPAWLSDIIHYYEANNHG